MAILTIANLKALWVNGYIPDSSSYADMFDSLVAASNSGGGISWSTPVDSNITPDGDLIRDLGSQLNNFNRAFLSQIHTDNIMIYAGYVEFNPQDTAPPELSKGGMYFDNDGKLYAHDGISLKAFATLDDITQGGTSLSTGDQEISDPIREILLTGANTQLDIKSPANPIASFNKNNIHIYKNMILNTEPTSPQNPTTKNYVDSTCMLNIDSTADKTNRYCFGVHPNINNGNYFSGYRSTIANPSSDADFDILGFSS